MLGSPILLELEVVSRRREEEIEERLRRRSQELALQSQSRPEPILLSVRRRVGLRLVAAGARVAGPAAVPPCEAA